MKNSLKVALGIAVSGALILLNQKRKKSKKVSENFTAPDGNNYRENEMYRTSDGDIYKNGKLMHFDNPELSAAAHDKIDSYLYKKNNVKDHYQSLSHNVTYHKKGIRHH